MDTIPRLDRQMDVTQRVSFHFVHLKHLLMRSSRISGSIVLITAPVVQKFSHRSRIELRITRIAGPRLG